MKKGRKILTIVSIILIFIAMNNDIHRVAANGYGCYTILPESVVINDRTTDYFSEGYMARISQITTGLHSGRVSLLETEMTITVISGSIFLGLGIFGAVTKKKEIIKTNSCPFE